MSSPQRIFMLITVLLLQSTLALAIDNINRKALSTDLGTLSEGIISLDYEHQRSIKQSFLLKLKSWNWEASEEREGSGVGYGVGYRYYFNRPLKGYFYGLGIELMNMTAYQNKGTSNEVVENNTIFYPYFESGYYYYLPKNFQASLVLRNYFGIGQLRDTDYPFFGWLVVPNFSIGYRF